MNENPTTAEEQGQRRSESSVSYDSLGKNRNWKQKAVFGLMEPNVFSLFFLARCWGERLTRGS